MEAGNSDATNLPNHELQEADNKRSSVWKEFLKLKGTETKDGKERALCSHCKVASFIASSHYGTTNLKRHLDKCPSYQQTVKVESNVYDQRIYRDLLARAIIKHGYAFSWVKHKSNREIHAYLNNQVRTICRNTAKSDVLKLHSNLKIELKNYLCSIPGRICLTFDMWNSCQTEGYMCLTAHFVDTNWKLNSRVLNFHHIETPHTGQILHNSVLSLLQDWGIEDKIFSITLDNASSNDRMQDRLRSTLNNQKNLLHDGIYLHVRCGAHVLNLIVKDGLKVIEDIVVKIRDSVKYIKWSESRKTTFRNCVKLARISDTKALWLDVPTRWNSTYLMIDRAIIYRNGFKEMVVVDPLYKNFPGPQEWDMLEKIRDILEPFYDITELFSSSQYPTTNLYFENVWKIEMLLNELVKGDDEVLRKMAIEMKIKFDKYWDNLDGNEYGTLFAFAIILDPHCKLDFLKYCYQNLFEDGIRASLKVSDMRFKLGMLLVEYPSVNDGGTCNNSCGTSSTLDTNTLGSTRKRKFDFSAGFDENETAYTYNEKTKLDKYLDDPRMDCKIKLNILDFWRENESQYRELAHLARDILSVTLTTVASESTFSIGGRVLSKWRSSYLPENIEALITTRSWLYGFEATEEDEYVGCNVGWDGANPLLDILNKVHREDYTDIFEEVAGRTIQMG